MRHLVSAAAVCFLTSSVAQASPIIAPGTYFDGWTAKNDRSEDPEPREFVFINYFLSRFTATNQLADPVGLRGVSLGPIGIGDAGSATRTTADSTNFYVEQRWIPVLSYSPYFVDGLADFNAAFEVDYTWGIAANGIQQNVGGGFNADQINIQTKNVNVSLRPTGDPYELSIIIGTQPVYDSVYNPLVTPLSTIVRTGYKLAFLGSDGSGITVFSSLAGQWKLSLLPLTGAQPLRASENDPTFKYSWLASLDYAVDLAPGTNLGASYWFLRDDTDGQGFAFPALARNGPGANSGLPPFTGVPAHNIQEPSGYVNYFGVHANHNIDFTDGRFAASGFVMVNQGEFQSESDTDVGVDSLSVLGASANLEALYRWGKTANDVVSIEGMYSTGDSDLTDDEYTGAFTLNHYGLPGAVWFNHKTLILFPFTSVVSNYTGAVTDISNQGYGLRAGIFAARWDLIPDKLNFKAGAAHAWADVKPPNFVAGRRRGKDIGTEINAEFELHFRYLMTLGVHAAYMIRGSFYEANPNVTADPWAFFTTFTWYGF